MFSNTKKAQKLLGFLTLYVATYSIVNLSDLSKSLIVKADAAFCAIGLLILHFIFTDTNQ